MSVGRAIRLGGEPLHLPLTERVRDLFAALAKSGKEDLDHSALILQVEAL